MRLPTLPGARPETRFHDKAPLFTETEARLEAERCLYCVDAPCTIACPTHIDVPTFIKKIATGNVVGSAKTILTANVLGYSCARVCPVEVLCAGACVYTNTDRPAIEIGRLQRYAMEITRSRGLPFTPKAKSGKKVALVGSGPASIACAVQLTLDGHDAVIFEKRSIPGGLNTYGIAPYKLLATDALDEVAWVMTHGGKIELDKELGRDVLGAELLAQYDAIFIGLGLGEDSTLDIGAEPKGVYGATRFIEMIKTAPSIPVLGRVLVIGGGNTAIDAARESVGLGATETSMAYRRGSADMSGYVHELEGARKEGVSLVEYATPAAYIATPGSEGRITAMRFKDTRDPKREFELPCDTVLLAIGQAKLGELAKQFEGVAVDAKGRVVIDATGRTGNPKVFAGGDCVNGGKEVVNAVADGQLAAKAMNAVFAGAATAPATGGMK